MIYSTIVQTSSGICTWPQATSVSNSEDDQIARREKAASMFGGLASDYNYLELSQSDYNAIKGNIPGRSLMVGGVLSLSSPPTLGKDKASITADGVDAITINADVGDAGYAGIINWEVQAPDGSISSAQDNAIGGSDDWILTTTQIGTHRIKVETLEHGISFIEFEGVA